jgi:hypothetical protein
MNGMKLICFVMKWEGKHSSVKQLKFEFFFFFFFGFGG